MLIPRQQPPFLRQGAVEMAQQTINPKPHHIHTGSTYHSTSALFAAIGNTSALEQQQDEGKSDCVFIENKPRVKGSLKRHLQFWRETLEASPHILSIIEHGYKIPFRYNPPSFEFKNNKSAVQNKEFVNKTLRGL